MVVIGLGTPGTMIATEFKKWSQYRVILPKLPKRSTVEEYEEKTPNFKQSFKGVKGDVWFMVCGASKEAGCTLRIMEQIKHCRIKVLYIYPEMDFLSSEAKKRHRVVFNVLQEYARSGVLDSIYIISNEIIEKVAGGGTINNYYNKINETIAHMIHYYNIYNMTEPVMGGLPKPKVVSRIRTLGTFDMSKNQEKYLFPLDNLTETCYIYNITENDLENDSTLLGNIKDKAKTNVSKDITSSFAIYETEYDKNFCHIVAYTHYIQEKS